MDYCENYLKILEQELVPALGCTEPIAIAFAAAKARAVLGCFPEKLKLYCSGNIVKNVMGVTVPNSDGLRGIDVAGALGAVCGLEERELEVLEGVTAEGIEKAQKLIEEGFVESLLQEGVANLYIRAQVFAGEHFAEVTVEQYHTNITRIIKDGKEIFSAELAEEKEIDKSFMTVQGILDFADSVPVERLEPILGRQIEMNLRIAEEGIENPYGAQVGRTLLAAEGDSVQVRARAKAAAGSDARMDGCSLPVVINSGSGNQGITVCVPVVEYAKELGIGEEKLYRALAVSNLISVHIKRHIGSLSAFCGAVSAACAAGTAITYMMGGSYEQICGTIVNTLGNTSGIICDGAKASCAAKISCALEAAILGHHMSMAGIVLPPYTGIIKDDIEETIRSVGAVGKNGMSETDITILNIMLHGRKE